ncbi:hypothetical protein BCV69DRAFT_283295 [Microstroma glucosiphilum]|uniref:Uncharacterized protein n=1 Tax=Pseudomicrostroma glucosiphilum TaxID=1684307 RepID=A0A316U584_9BASI|nr:hypothetical protein BCV69DRAFT_283295 [Pseudomicrostroma glucosiphilum]PWN20417.1 hypothetical protein BCV69DRAFT_283295 [Pseudomicrostroma glucosiphilum]
MTSLVTNYATKRMKGVVSNHAAIYEPEDPFYITYVDDNGKQKRTKRPPPPGLTKKEASLLRKIQRRAHYLDKGINLCGFRVGWTFFIGLIPGAGDIADASLNYFLVLKPAKNELDLPSWLVQKMLFNNAVSAGVGLVPLVGDIVLAIWRANWRNAKLLEEFLRVKGEENMANGLTGLTPHTDARGRKVEHPAQGAARQAVLESQGQGRQSGQGGQQQQQQPMQGSVAGAGAGTTAGTSGVAAGSRRKP